MTNQVTSSNALTGGNRASFTEATLLEQVKAGLRAEPKAISPVWFYDEIGSSLFDAICNLSEYYLTRSEISIMQRYAGEMAQLIGHRSTGETALEQRTALIEYGSGTSLKTRLLLDCLPQHTTYIPVDIARTHLLRAAASIAHDYPKLNVLPVCADFTRPFQLPANFDQRSEDKHRLIVYFPGSTLGNFSVDAAHELLSNIRKLIGTNGALLIGLDLKKDLAVLLPAYNDVAGITAKFNLNALTHLNRKLGANFDISAFRHSAVWVEDLDRIEMRLISLRDQMVTLGNDAFPIRKGEYLHTESSHKYTLPGFSTLANAAGLEVKHVWLDEEKYFSVQWLEAIRN